MKYYLVYQKPMFILAENAPEARKKAEKMIKNGYKGEIQDLERIKIAENDIFL